MTDQSWIGVALGVIGLASWAIAERAARQNAQAKLTVLELKNKELQNEKRIHSLSDADLSADVAKNIGGT